MTMKNAKGRLSPSDIDRMVQEAEKRATENAKTKEKVEAEDGFSAGREIERQIRVQAQGENGKGRPGLIGLAR
jgi:molecular chaperone DnaK (HSP70)